MVILVIPQGTFGIPVARPHSELPRHQANKSLLAGAVGLVLLSLVTKFRTETKSTSHGQEP